MQPVMTHDVKRSWPGYEVSHMTERDDISSDSESTDAWVVVVRKCTRTSPPPIMAKYQADEDGKITELIYKRNITLEDIDVFQAELEKGKVFRFKNDWA